LTTENQPGRHRRLERYRRQSSAHAHRGMDQAKLKNAVFIRRHMHCYMTTDIRATTTT